MLLEREINMGQVTKVGLSCYLVLQNQVTRQPPPLKPDPHAYHNKCIQLISRFCAKWISKHFSHFDKFFGIPTHVRNRRVHIGAPIPQLQLPPNLYKATWVRLGPVVWCKLGMRNDPLELFRQQIARAAGASRSQCLRRRLAFDRPGWLRLEKIHYKIR